MMWLDKEDSFLADSTFYLCFLEDIGKPEILLKILSMFKFFMPPLVLKEVSLCRNYNKIRGMSGITVLTDTSVGELLRPYLSSREIEKGEAEVIALAYIWNESAKIRNFILDDQEARKFVMDNFPRLKQKMIGTVSFIGCCHCLFKLFVKDLALQILKDIHSSPFRVTDNILNEVKQKIEGC